MSDESPRYRDLPRRATAALIHELPQVSPASLSLSREIDAHEALV